MTYSAEVLTDTPIVYWKLEDPSGTTSPVADSSSGGTRTGTVNGTVTPGFGDTAIFPLLGTALGLSGGGSNYVYRSADSAWDFGTGDFAVEFVVIDNNSLSNYSELFGLDNSASGNGLDLYVNQTTGTLRLWCGGTAMNGSTSIVDGDPHLVTITRESGVVKFYIDGQLDASGTLAGSLLTGQVLRVGIVSNAYPSLIGEIGHFSLYAHSLSEARIEAHAEALGIVVITEDPNQGAFGYIYENVGFDVVSEQEADAYAYENVGFHVVNTQEAHGFAYENVGYVPVDPDDPKQAEAYIFEEVIGFVGSYWGIRLGTGGTPVAPDSRKIYVISEEFPSALVQIDPDSETLDTLLGPVETGTTSVGPASWEEGGVGIDGVQYIATHTPYTPGAHFWDDLPFLRIRSLPADLSSSSTAVDTTSKFLKSSQKSGSNCIAAGNGKVYAFVGTDWEAYSAGFGTVHAMMALKIVEVDVDGTVARTFDFPDPPDWFTGPMASYPPFYEYPGEDSSSIPSLCITPDGTTIYGVVMKPQPTWGEDTWSQCIFKCDVASGTITEFIPDISAEPGFRSDGRDFITANWPEETNQSNWDIDSIGGMACADNGDLLIGSLQNAVFIIRVASDGSIVQLLVGQNAPSSPAPPDDSLYATTGMNVYDGIQGICVKGEKVYLLAEVEVYLDDGGGLPAQSYSYVTDDTHHWVVALDMPNPTTTPISLVPTTGFPRHMFTERVYCIWTG